MSTKCLKESLTKPLKCGIINSIGKADKFEKKKKSLPKTKTFKVYQNKWKTNTKFIRGGSVQNTL